MTSQPTRTPVQPACQAEFGMDCAHTTSGHSLHPMRRRLAAATPSRWADAIVTAINSDGSIELRSVETGATATVWHHESIAGSLSVGEPVALHAVYDVLAIGSDWRSVATAL